VLGGDILKPFASLVVSSFVDNMQDWLSTNVEDVDDD
jgi:hypothetical protein